MAITNILYYIPQDDDDLKVMNTFVIQKSTDEVRLADIETHFPVQGRYHFRFQFKYRGVLVWLDLSNRLGKLPQTDGAIIVKALRLGWGPKAQPEKPAHIIRTAKSEMPRDEGAKLVNDIFGGFDQPTQPAVQRPQASDLDALFGN